MIQDQSKSNSERGKDKNFYLREEAGLTPLLGMTQSFEDSMVWKKMRLRRLFLSFAVVFTFPNILPHRDLGPYSQNILRLKVAPNLPIKEKILKIVDVSVLNLGLLDFCSKSISQSVKFECLTIILLLIKRRFICIYYKKHTCKRRKISWTFV